MKLKQVIGSLTAAATIIATTAFPQMSVYAATDFATAQDFLTDVINTSLTEIESSGKAAAVNTTTGKITTNGDEVLFDGARIGYWTSSTSSTLYADNAFTTPLIEEVAEGYDCDPTVLKALLADTNSNIVENYTPTTDDWSKIVGRYDITLGDITIPAEQWVPAEYETDKDPLLNGKAVNISQLSGIDANTRGYGGAFSSDAIYVCAWLVDDQGKLYLQTLLQSLSASSKDRDYYLVNGDVLSGTLSQDSLDGQPSANTITLSSNGGTICYPASLPLIKAGLIRINNGLFTRIYATTSTHSSVRCPNITDYLVREYTAALRSIGDASVTSTCNIDDAKAYGIVYFTGAQAPAIDTNTFTNEHNKMFTSYSTSKLVRGNTKLTKRVNALTQLEPANTITVKANGWYTLNGSNIDTIVTTQNIQSAGDTADISAVADVEPLNFNVIVPSALPIYVDSNGVVSTATNASIINRSGAPIQITGVDITAKPESGWTLVQGTPSKQFEAKEFSFLTSIENLTVLDCGQEMPFTYGASLSPTTVGEDGLDIATVSVTVDWAS